jgi:hypothetical protein
MFNLFSRNLSELEREMRAKSDEELREIIAEGQREAIQKIIRGLRICLELERRLHETEFHGRTDRNETKGYVEKGWAQLEELLRKVMYE